MSITPHPELPGYYNSHGWAFSIDPEEDGNLEYVDEAILAWTEWREFLATQDQTGPETLF